MTRSQNVPWGGIARGVGVRLGTCCYRVLEDPSAPGWSRCSRTAGPTATEPGSSACAIEDPDAQLALWILYELAYRGFDGVARRARVGPPPAGPARRLGDGRSRAASGAATRELVDSVDDVDDPAEQVLAMVDRADGVSLSTFLRREATREQVLEYLRERSVQQLKESDPQSFVLPRLDGRGQGRAGRDPVRRVRRRATPSACTSTCTPRRCAAAGLDPSYGAYVDEISAVSLASANVMSLFVPEPPAPWGRARPLRGLRGHQLGAVTPGRRGDRAGRPGADRGGVLRRARRGGRGARAGRGPGHVWGVVAEHPDRRGDVLFGAAAALHLDALSGPGPDWADGRGDGLSAAS